MLPLLYTHDKLLYHRLMKLPLFLTWGNLLYIVQGVLIRSLSQQPCK